MDSEILRPDGVQGALPARTSALEEMVPKALHASLDNPAVRLVVQACIDSGHDPLVVPATKPVKTERAYKQNLEKWFAHAELTAAELLELDHEARCDKVDEFIASLAPTMTTASLKAFHVAINWWAKENSIVSPVTHTTKAIVGTGGKTRGKAPALEATVLVDLIEACDNRTLLGDKKCTTLQSEAFHIRFKAVLLVCITLALRAESELPHLRDDGVLSIDEEGILIRGANVKGKRQRIVRLQPREDVGCPVRALSEWLQFCSDNNIDRGGLLLPTISVHRRELISNVKKSERTHWDKYVRPYLASLTLDDGTPKYPDVTKFRLHGLRSTMITEAVLALNSGEWAHTDLRDLGDWVNLSTAMRYDRSGPSGINLYGGES